VLKKLEEELEEFRREAWNCFRCSMCKHIYPWHIMDEEYYEICPSGARYKFDAYFSQGRMDIIRAYLEGDLKDSPQLKDIIYSCTSCGACEYVCSRINGRFPRKNIEAFRAKLVEDGKGPMPGHQPIITSIRNYDNPWMQPRARRGAWAKRLKIKDLAKETAEVAYFVGCTYSYHGEMKRVAENTAKLLKAGGVEFGILGKAEQCCGSPLRRIGMREEFGEKAEGNIANLERAGVKTVITSCSGCFSTLKRDYPDVRELPFEVKHAVEAIDELIQKGKLKLTKPVKKKVTYHDPCHLGRCSRQAEPTREDTGVYDAPRRILESIPGLEFVEMFRIKDSSWCCGAGGGVKSAYPDFAVWSAKERVKEAKATEAEVLVSACPWCESNLGDAVQGEQNTMPIVNILDLVMEAL
jgi:Fe-S oxidoreductase